MTRPNLENTHRADLVLRATAVVAVGLALALVPLGLADAVDGPSRQAEGGPISMPAVHLSSSGRDQPLRRAGPAQDVSHYVHVDTWTVRSGQGTPLDVAINRPRLCAERQDDMDCPQSFILADGAGHAVESRTITGHLQTRREFPNNVPGRDFVPVAIDTNPDRVFGLWFNREMLESGTRHDDDAFLVEWIGPANLSGTFVFNVSDFARPGSDVAVHPDAMQVFVTRPAPEGEANLYVAQDESSRRTTELRTLAPTDAPLRRVSVVGTNRLATVDANGQVDVFTLDGVRLMTVDLGGATAVDVEGHTDESLSVLVRSDGSADPPAVLYFDRAGVLAATLTASSLGIPPIPNDDFPFSLGWWDGSAAVVSANQRTLTRGIPDTASPGAGFTIDGAYHLPEFRAGPRPPDGAGVLAMDLRPDGVLAVIDSKTGTLSEIDTSGAAQPVAQVGPGTIDIAAGAGGMYHVTTADHRITTVDPSGVITDPAGLPCECDLGGRLASGAGILYATRPRSGEVAAFDLGTGTLVRRVTLPEPVGLWPADVTVTPGGRLFTADMVRAQVHGWLNADAPDLTWQAGLFAGPRRLAAGRIPGGAEVIAALMADGTVEIHDVQTGNIVSQWPPRRDDGAHFTMNDLEMDTNGRILIADGEVGEVLVFEPGQGATPTPVPNPSVTPTPSDRSCDVAGNKVAGPSEIVLGNSTTVTLTLAARCPDITRVSGADIVLAIDRSGSMRGDRIAAAKDAARTFVEFLDVRYHRVGLVSFNDNASLDVPLTANAAEVIDGIRRIEAAGGTLIVAGLQQARTNLLDNGRPDGLPVVVLLSDGKDATTGSSTIARELRDNGFQIYTIGLGEQADQALLVDIAGRPDRFFYAPTPADLFPIYSEILRVVVSSLAGNLVIDDTMAANITYLPNSAEPAALEAGNRLRWGRSLLPASGVTLTYGIRPEVAGRLPTNREAWAEYTDGDGVRRRFVFPVPEIHVVTPSPTPSNTPTPTATPTNTPTNTPVPDELYLPIAYNGACIPLRVFADVVLLIDTSSSMSEGDKLPEAKAGARAFVRQLQLPQDQAAVVGFDANARLAAGLTGDRDTLVAAIDGLALGSGTHIDAALAVGRSELFAGGAARPESRKVIVLLSDGAHAGPVEAVLREADAAKASGALIYTIGLGADADRNLLTAVASSPRAFFHAPDESQLAEIYAQLALTLPCR